MLWKTTSQCSEGYTKTFLKTEQNLDVIRTAFLGTTQGHYIRTLHEDITQRHYIRILHRDTT